MPDIYWKRIGTLELKDVIPRSVKPVALVTAPAAANGIPLAEQEIADAEAAAEGPGAPAPVAQPAVDAAAAAEAAAAGAAAAPVEVAQQPLDEDGGPAADNPPACAVAAADMWLIAAPIVSGYSHIRVTAKGEWRAAAEASICGPDGYLDQPVVAKDVITIECAMGALIGRFGGSSAAYPPGAPVLQTGNPSPAPAVAPADKPPFSIGRLCILAVPDKMVGPLYVGFNTRALPVLVKSLEITVEGANPTL